MSFLLQERQGACRMEGATVAAVGTDAGSGAAFPWLRSYPPGVSWDIDLPTETLPEMFDAAVARFGSKTCLEFMGRRWSFAAMGALVDSAAAGFRSLEIGRASCRARV